MAIFTEEDGDVSGGGIGQAAGVVVGGVLGYLTGSIAGGVAVGSQLGRAVGSEFDDEPPSSGSSSPGQRPVVSPPPPPQRRSRMVYISQRHGFHDGTSVLSSFAPEMALSLDDGVIYHWVGTTYLPSGRLNL